MAKVELTCAECGVRFLRSPSLIRKNKSGVFFCSLACRNLAWQGMGNPNHGHHWTPEQRLSMATKKLGTPAWNKGLTAETSESVRAYAATLIGNRHGHAHHGKSMPWVTERNRADNPSWRPEVQAKTRARMQEKTGDKNSNWRGGVSYVRGSDWRAISAEIRERDGHCCRACGMTTAANGKALHVHHIVPYEQTADNSPENLVSLCIGCHTKVSFGTLDSPTN